MTFESMIENININAENEPLAVKVSYGDELRRTTFNGVGYDALRDVVAKLFGLDPASVVLKYQDDDGDKITMVCPLPIPFEALNDRLIKPLLKSTDGELKDALQSAKEKKLLRLFVDIKGPAPVPAEEENQPPHFYHPFAARRFGGPLRGGHRGSFGFGPGPHGHPHPPHHYRGGHHGFGGPHPHPPHHESGPHGHPHPPPHCGFPAPPPAEGGPNGHPHPPPPHGGFPPHGFPPHFGRGGPYGGPWAHKAHKHAMKEHKNAMRDSMKEQKHAFKLQIKLMKENATTPDDFLAIKEYKKQMREEWKGKWQQGMRQHPHCHEDNKKDRYIAKHVADVTIPDNSELPADTPATKTWRLKNVGATAWPADSQLIFISRRGDNLNGPERVPVGSVDPQQEVEVSLTFITPSEPGRYIGYYRMATSDGAKFGQRVWVSFLVPHTPTVNATTTSTGAPAPLASDIAMD